jgi:hypothetical protein
LIGRAKLRLCPLIQPAERCWLWFTKKWAKRQLCPTVFFMFTGIIQETGMVEKIERGKKSIALTVVTGAVARGLKIGDSVAVNGC